MLYIYFIIKNAQKNHPMQNRIVFLSDHWKNRIYSKSYLKFSLIQQIVVKCQALDGWMDGYIEQTKADRPIYHVHLIRVARRIKLNNINVFQNLNTLYKYRYVSSYTSPKFKLKVLILWEKYISKG